MTKKRRKQTGENVWEKYREEKHKLPKNLTPEKYEKEIKKVVEKLKI